MTDEQVQAHFRIAPAQWLVLTDEQKAEVRAAMPPVRAPEPVPAPAPTPEAPKRGRKPAAPKAPSDATLIEARAKVIVCGKWTTTDELVVLLSLLEHGTQ